MPGTSTALADPQAQRPHLTGHSLYGRMSVGQGTVIGEYCVLGCPKEARLRDPSAGEAAPVVGERCLIFHHVVVYEGSRITDDCVLEDCGSQPR
jgi:acetyltransferase-like isoleucine patch superfamily enzyme